MSGSTLTRRAGAALGATLLAAGLAACGSSGSDGGSAPVATQSGTPGPTATAQPGETTQRSGAPGRARLESLTVNGDDQGTDFPDTRCEWETDHGHPQLEFQAQNDAADTQLEVEIVMSDPPRLDDFEFETPQNEWEASDADAAQAEITADGDTYRVDSPVTADDGAAARMAASLTCPKR